MPRVRTLDAMGGVRTRDVCLTSHISTIRLPVSLFPMRPFFKPEHVLLPTLLLQQMISHGDQSYSTNDSEVSCENMIRPEGVSPSPLDHSGTMTVWI